MPRRTRRYHMHGLDRGMTHNKHRHSAKKAMKGSKHNLKFRQKEVWPTPCKVAYDLKRDKRHSKRKYKRDTKKALDSLRSYEKYNEVKKDDESLRGVSREMMDIVEDISEKRTITDNQYLEMMNLLLKIHKKAEKEERDNSLCDPYRLRMFMSGLPLAVPENIY